MADTSLDGQTYEAVVRLKINSRYNQLPTDTSTSVFTAGRLGEQYVELEAGGSQQFLGEKDEIKLTQSAVALEQITGQFLYIRAAQAGGT